MTSRLLGFVVLFLHDARDVGAATAAAALGVLQIVGALVRIVAGRRSDREGLRIAPMRRIAARNAALLAVVGALAPLAPLAAFAVLRPLEGEEDDRITARVLRARDIPEPLPVEAT